MYVTIIGNDLPPHYAERSPSFIRKGGRSLREPDKGYSEHYQKGFKQSRYSLSFSSRHQVGSNIIITALMEMESLLREKRGAKRSPVPWFDLRTYTNLLRLD